MQMIWGRKHYGCISICLQCFMGRSDYDPAARREQSWAVAPYTDSDSFRHLFHRPDTLPSHPAVPGHAQNRR